MTQCCELSYNRDVLTIPIRILNLPDSDLKIALLNTFAGPVITSGIPIPWIIEILRW